MVTIAVALALILIGLSATVFPMDFVNQALAFVQGYVGTDIEVTTQVAWWCLLGGNLLLFAGSLFPGV